VADRFDNLTESQIIVRNCAAGVGEFFSCRKCDRSQTDNRQVRKFSVALKLFQFFDELSGAKHIRTFKFQPIVSRLMWDRAKQSPVCNHASQVGLIYKVVVEIQELRGALRPRSFQPVEPMVNSP